MKYAFMIFAVIIAVALVGCSNKNGNNLNPVDPAVSSLAKMGNNMKSSSNFQAHLNGATMLPPNSSIAQGEAIFSLSKDSSSIHYKLIVANIDDVFMAHIHIGGSATTKGKIAVWLYGDQSNPPSGLIPGRFDGTLAEGTITDADLTGPMADSTITDLVHEFMKGDAYVIVHTTQNPGGEIRGHIQ